jgi:hypothetical protein
VATGIDAEGLLAGAPEFAAATVAPSAAIDAVTRRAGGPVRVSTVRLRRLPARLAYEVNTAQGSYLVDAADASIVSVTEDLAKQIVARVLRRDVSFGPVTRQSERTLSYAGALPAYRLPLEDVKGTVFYVDVATAQVRLTDRLSRAAGLVMGLHGLWFLRLILPAVAVQALMLTFAVIGTAMSLTGVVILIAQLRRWWRRASVRSIEAYRETPRPHVAR